MGKGPKRKNWCFTLNNYTPEDEESLRLACDGADISFLVYGREVGESGTPHLQGFVTFVKERRLKPALEIMGVQAHLSAAKYPRNAIDYCKKGEQTKSEWDKLKTRGSNYGLNYSGEEFGTDPIATSTGQGRRSDLEALKADVNAGKTDEEYLLENHSTVMASSRRFVEDYIKVKRPRLGVEPFPLRPWQQSLYQSLMRPPDPREIVFVVDEIGNQGKSWFADYFEDLHRKRTQVFEPGKKADMAYQLRDDRVTNTFFMDCPRSKQGDFIQYDFLEALKNKRVFSPKYDSKTKYFPPTHVVVLMNEMPDETKLSSDRYNIIKLT